MDRISVGVAPSQALGQLIDIEAECWPSTAAVNPDEPGLWQATDDMLDQRRQQGFLLAAMIDEDIELDRLRGDAIQAKKGDIAGFITAYPTTWVAGGSSQHRTAADTVEAILAKEFNGGISWAEVVELGVPESFAKATDHGRILSRVVAKPSMFHLISIAVPSSYRGAFRIDDHQITSFPDMLAEALKLHAQQAGADYVFGVTTLPLLHQHPELSADHYITALDDRSRLLDPNLRRYQRSGAVILRSAAQDYMPEDRNSRGHGAMVIMPVSARARHFVQRHENGFHF